MFSMSLSREFQLLQILNDLSVRHLIKLILYENDVKILKFNRSPAEVDLRYVWSLRFWLLIPEMNTSRKAMEWLICFSIINLMLGCLLFKSQQKSLYTRQKRLSSLTRDCNLPIFTANEAIPNLTQYELSQEESDLLKAGLYFSIHPDKIQKSKIFTTFEKIHRLFLNNLNQRKPKVR